MPLFDKYLSNNEAWSGRARRGRSSRTTLTTSTTACLGGRGARGAKNPALAFVIDSAGLTRFEPRVLAVNEYDFHFHFHLHSKGTGLFTRSKAKGAALGRAGHHPVLDRMRRFT